uniref:CCT domain-containing protein n=1 Tax=Tetraselmis sp. GSL018 TaxID=582737 RepID=A0A061SME2_9CHLO|mmetsp:Transcript_13083/g.31014  ORF Transcript_13083/g.31014 Transcript_13083/m.31014 type:complete len:345 (+) Transcript_13083:126-1160(+)
MTCLFPNTEVTSYLSSGEPTEVRTTATFTELPERTPQLRMFRKSKAVRGFESHFYQNINANIKLHDFHRSSNSFKHCLSAPYFLQEDFRNVTDNICPGNCLKDLSIIPQTCCPVELYEFNPPNDTSSQPVSFEYPAARGKQGFAGSENFCASEDTAESYKTFPASHILETCNIKYAGSNVCFQTNGLDDAMFGSTQQYSFSGLQDSSKHEIFDGLDTSHNCTNNPPSQSSGTMLALDTQSVLDIWQRLTSPKAGSGVQQSEACQRKKSFASFESNWQASEASQENCEVLGLKNCREAQLQRYRDKKQRRLRRNHVRYTLRKANADKRPRFRGRFLSKKSVDEAR